MQIDSLVLFLHKLQRKRSWENRKTASFRLNERFRMGTYSRYQWQRHIDKQTFFYVHEWVSLSFEIQMHRRETKQKTGRYRIGFCYDSNQSNNNISVVYRWLAESKQDAICLRQINTCWTIVRHNSFFFQFCEGNARAEVEDRYARAGVYK